MRSLVASAIAVSSFIASGAHALFVVAQNLPVPPVSGGGEFMVQPGNYSDAFSSGGDYFNGLSLAQGFSTGGGQTLDRLTVWGASDYIGNATPWTRTALSTNVIGFQVVLLKQNTFGVYVQQTSWNISRASVTQTLTGNYTPSSLSPVFQLSMDLPGSFAIASGTYYLGIGAILSNPDGDAWQWTNGQWDGTDPVHPYIATTADTPTSWGQWSVVTTGVSGSMLLESNILPGPAVGAVFAAGAFARGGSRRRRS